MLNELLEYNVEINQKNKNGDTALHIATKNGYKDIVNLLLIHKADLNIKNNNQNTPLEIA